VVDLRRLMLIAGVLLFSISIAHGQGNFTVTIFRSADSVTVYLPPDLPLVNLSGLQFQTTTATGAPINQLLETLPAFRGLPYATLPTPICFHITRSAAPTAPPLECQTILLLTQTLADANVFWYDLSSRQDRTLTMMLSGVPRICPAGSVRCDLDYPLPTPTATFPPTPSPLPTATPQTLPTLDVNAAIAATRAAIETSTATQWTPTPTSTLTPTEDIFATINAALTATEVYNRAYSGVTRNEDWTPIIETFGNVEMVRVPAGSFTMGSTNAQIDAGLAMCQAAADNNATCERSWFEDELIPLKGNAQTMTPFWIDRTEVTRAMYGECVAANVCEETPASEYSTAPEQPINRVTWVHANAFCQWRGARLPTEAEWEYAARGPSGWIFPWGNEFDGTRANHCDGKCGESSWASSYNYVNEENDDGYAVTAPVGSYPAGASWVGALDMSGNVWEWVSSIFQPYPYAADDGRENAQDTNSLRVLRGGSFSSSSNVLRAPNRGRDYPSDEFINRGFRCARSS
jgi:formylglycine-generating enzyme